MSTQLKLVVLILLFLIGAVVSLAYGGSAPLSWKMVSADDFIFMELRFPKTITAILAGCALSVSGLILQVIFRNPLAGPYVLGISSGASLAVAIVLLTTTGIFAGAALSAGRSALIVGAVSGSFAVTVIILGIAKNVKDNTRLLLIGLMMAQIFGAAEMSLQFFADPGAVKNFVVWGMGTLSSTTLADLPLLSSLMILALASGVFLFKPLNALLLGEDYARSVGINVQRARILLITLASVLTGVVTAFCGPIAFVGIAVPVLSRMLFKSSRQQLHYFACLLTGSIILLFSDAVAHNIIRGSVLPVNVMTTIIGAPVVIWMIYRSRQW
jgi:iron complex transport system permease protein